GSEAMAHAIAQCDIHLILTSRVFLAKASIEPVEGMVYLEDVLKQMNQAALTARFALLYLAPARLLNRLFFDRRGAARTAAVIFSSGRTGVPKGVVLTHRNILANIDGVCQVFRITPDDVALGVLPFFHSFGFTGTLWLPLIAGFAAVYHPNPTDAKTIGELG